MGVVIVTAPLFTASTGFALIERSPWHAITELQQPDEPSDVMDLGTIVHGCLLTGEANAVVLDFPDWRTKLARDSRDAVRAEGKTPVLAHKWVEVQAMVKAARHQLERVEPPTPFVGGWAEQSLYFALDGVSCRATPDWVSTDYRHVVDLKTTSASAHPGVFSKAVWGNGNAFQSAFYRRAVKTVYGVAPEFRWIALETFPPYALSVVALDPEASAFADQQVTEALRLWKACVSSGEWPGYTTRTTYVDAPPYVQTQWLERSYFDHVPAR